MLPLYLSVEGFYSYQEKQEIDFTALTEAGLFGIFGAVGSGKSSILEAISLALYGDTERLNKTDRRGYNMLNLKSSQAKIVFDLLNFEGKKHRFVAQWKRRASKFEDTSTIERSAYRWEAEQWIPLESADGSLVTNLSYANFRRTIIIPQGQFKEFLELKGKERSEMMKEIFQLNRYDLGPKVSALQQVNNQKLENLRGALSGYESISPEILAEKEANITAERELLTNAKKELDLLQTQVQLLKEASERHRELANKQSVLQELIEQKDRVNYIRKELQLFEKTVQLFRDPLHSLQRMEKEKDGIGLRVEELQSHRKSLSEEIDTVQEKFERVDHDFRQIETWRKEHADFHLLALIRKHKALQQTAQINLKKGEPYVEQSKKELEKTQLKLRQDEEKLETLKEEKFDASALMEIETWYVSKDNIQKQMDQLAQEKKDVALSIETMEKQFSESGYHPNDFEEKIKQQDTLLQEQLRVLSEQETQWQVQIKLGDFAHALRDGEPCPLCGAAEHPHPMSSDHAHEELNTLFALRKELQQDILALQEKAKALRQSANAITNKKDQISRLEQNENLLNEQLHVHIKDFVWEQYSPEDKSLFGEQKLRNKQTEDAIRALEAELKNGREEIIRQTDTVAKYEKRMQSIMEEISLANNLITQYRNQLQTVEEDQYLQHDEVALTQLKQEHERKIAQTTEDHQSLTTLLHQKKTIMADIAGKYQTLKEQFSLLRESLKTYRAEIAQLLAENGYSDLAEVNQIIQKDLPVDKIRTEIHEFDVQLEVLQRSVADLIERTTNDNYSAEIFEEQQAKLTGIHHAYEAQLAQFGGLEKELTHLTLEYAKKEKLHEQHDELTKRAEQLKVMDNLFRGNGFVNYISTIHMERLCEIANQRFHRLTKNQLSLSVSEGNDFDVIDNLNDGRRRSVKTLSGGQSFQASLCLALALAENIQSLNKADKNFFFIDEGFGTQDHESINTVFDTLQYLHQENRVVGIISHVEELKERMPRAITITKDFDRGSLVGMV
ncbi:AAA family ATPase [Sphingobacterium corticis]|uniref:AAA family ATPase n=1 Tax=Sphingobacterium corticis TaxID=1812823 RepID=A0ABW5NLY5_9SPHI